MIMVLRVITKIMRIEIILVDDKGNAMSRLEKYM